MKQLLQALLNGNCRRQKKEFPASTPYLLIACCAGILCVTLFLAAGGKSAQAQTTGSLPTVAIADSTSYFRPADAPAKTEGATLSWKLTRTGDTSQELTVPLRWFDRGAGDYATFFDFTEENPKPAEAVFEAGNSEVTVSVDTDADTSWELNTVLMVCISDQRTDGYRVNYLAPDSYKCAGFSLTDDDDPPLVTIEAVASTIEEGDLVDFVLRKQGTDLTYRTTVNVRVVKIDADGTRLFFRSDQNVTISANEQTKRFGFITRENSTNQSEDDYSIEVSILAAPARPGAPNGIYRTEAGTAKATTSVEDDDLPEISVTAVARQSESVPVDFAFSRTGDISKALTVQIELTDAGDFLPDDPPTSVTFDAGQASASISIAVDDGIDEINGGVIVIVTASDDYTRAGGAQQTTVLVSDDDEPQYVTVAASADSVEEGVNADFVLTRQTTDGSNLIASGAATKWPLTVNVEVGEVGDFIDGTPPTSITFPADVTSVTLTVPTVDDARPLLPTAPRFHSAYEADGSITAGVEAGDHYEVGLPESSSSSSETGDNTTATISVTDNEPPLVRAKVELDASDQLATTSATITEGQTATVTIQRYFFDSDNALTVDLELTDFRCSSSDDSVLGGRTLVAAEIPVAVADRTFSVSIPVSASTATHIISTSLDNVAECDVEFDVTVKQPSGSIGLAYGDWAYHPLDRDKTSITVEDDDVLPTISFTSPTVSENVGSANVESDSQVPFAPPRVR